MSSRIIISGIVAPEIAIETSLARTIPPNRNIANQRRARIEMLSLPPKIMSAPIPISEPPIKERIDIIECVVSAISP